MACPSTLEPIQFVWEVVLVTLQFARAESAQ
jgi:hypothetical protein